MAFTPMALSPMAFSSLLQHSSSAPLSTLQEPLPVIGSPDQLSMLRERCLKRDRHHCIITGHFDSKEFERRIKDGGTVGCWMMMVTRWT